MPRSSAGIKSPLRTDGHWPAFLPMWLFPVGCSALVFLPGFDRHAGRYVGAVALPLFLICAAIAVLPLRRRQATWPQTLYWGGVLPLMIWTTLFGGLAAVALWSGPMGRDLGALPSLIFGEDAPCKNAQRSFAFSVHQELLLTPDVEYTLCVHPGSTRVDLSVVRQVQRDSARTATRHIPLDAETYSRTVSLFEAAFNFNVLDGTMGLDGEQWCLATSRGYTDVKACFAGPSPEDAEQRGLQGVFHLAQALQQLEGTRGT